MGICLAAGIENFSEIFDTIVLQFGDQRYAAFSGKIASSSVRICVTVWTDGVCVEVCVRVSIINDDVAADLFVQEIIIGKIDIQIFIYHAHAFFFIFFHESCFFFCHVLQHLFIYIRIEIVVFFFVEFKQTLIKSIHWIFSFQTICDHVRA